MRWFSMPVLLAIAPAGLLLGCGDAGSPAAPAAGGTPHEAIHAAANVIISQTPEPFTARASLDPFRIHENPDFMIHSRANSDLVIQRLTFAPGAGGWHTHPGPSFVIVAAGSIKLERFVPRRGCTETAVFEVGDGYFEIGNEVHRAVVVSSEDAVLHVTRFIPIGAAISSPAVDPGC